MVENLIIKFSLSDCLEDLDETEKNKNISFEESNSQNNSSFNEFCLSNKIQVWCIIIHFLLLLEPGFLGPIRS